MDPITVTTTFITLGTFIKDLIEVGQSIQRSIEKVGENRRQIRELTKDVLRTLVDLADLTRGKDDAFQTPALLTALGNLKAEMLYVHSECCKISPMPRPGLQGFGAQLKAWIKRDDLEGKIRRLKDHVNKCYQKFTALSAARTERIAVRVEQTLIVDRIENQVKLHRIEGMMARMLLETEFGQKKLNQVMEIIGSDASHTSLEIRYLSLQTTRLVDSLQQLWTTGKLVLEDSFWDPMPLVFVESTCALDVLHWVLGTVRDLNKGPAEIQDDMMQNLGVFLSALGMYSEGIAWDLLKISIISPFAGRDCSAATLLQLADTLIDLSKGYQNQLQFRTALKASQQALDILALVPEGSIDVGVQPLLLKARWLNALVTHATNLHETGEDMTALSIAREAVVLSRPMFQHIIGSSSRSLLTDEEQFITGCSCDACFTLAQVLSSVDRHLESYEAFKEYFQTILRLPVLSQPFYEEEDIIDPFVDLLCKMAEGEGFSLVMLADCVILFRDLARQESSPDHCGYISSSRFLSVFHAYVYFAQQSTLPNAAPSTKNLRIFLEPNWACPPPTLDITMSVDLGAVDHMIIEDAIREHYTQNLSDSVELLIVNLIVTHFDQAIIVLREVVERVEQSWNISGILDSIVDILATISKTNRVALLQVMSRAVAAMRTIAAAQYDRETPIFYALRTRICRYLWRAGLLDEALAELDRGINDLESSPRGNDEASIVAEYQRDRACVLFDMGRPSHAIEMIQHTLPYDAVGSDPSLLLLKTHILRRMGRQEEALQLIRRGVAARSKTYWTNDNALFDLAFYALLVELAIAWADVGQPEKAYADAERAVAAWGKIHKTYAQEEKCAPVHALTVLSDCLAAVGREGEALAVAQEAASIYNQSAPYKLDFVYSRRAQELGAKAFHSLSLRLAATGELDQALVNAKRSTELHREVVMLAPRYLPTLANSLQSLASILWNIGRRDEAVTACEEAVSIMRNLVNPEPYLLPGLAESLDQLGAYLTEKGDIGGGSATAAECAEVRSKFACLPSQPEFLFEKVEMEWDDEEEEAEQYWKTVSNADDSEYHNASQMPVVSEGARISTTQLRSTAQILDGPSTEMQPKSCKIAIVEGDTGSSREPDFDAKMVDRDGIAMPFVAKSDDEHTATGITAESPIPTNIASPAITTILSTPLEVRLNMRSTPIDILWWILVGILLALFWSRLV